MVALIVWPVFRSNSGFIRSTAHRIPPGAMSVTSSARAADGALSASATTVIEMTSFISVPYLFYISRSSPAKAGHYVDSTALFSRRHEGHERHEKLLSTRSKDVVFF